MTKIRLIKPAKKVPPPPPCDFTPDEHLAAEGLLMLSQSVFSSSSKPSAAKTPTPAAAKPPVSALHARKPTPAAANPTQAPPIAALCAKNPTPAAATPPFAAAQPIKKTQYLSLLPPSRSYVCGICGVAFKRPQELGGHKTCHREKPTTTAAAALTITGSRNNDRLHECSICHKPFNSGQALGGHMRRHYEGKIGGPNKSAKTSSTGSPGRVSSEDDGPSNASTRILDFDLNLPCPESDYVFE
ncbi:hypothetical protein CASFOL_041887 [Castilleja foliolosa]|uniref:C2H2-type domain-containing protein n=1 Tax=Castilleja foliolosa TaxID=1961234 RepID=A0ABD3B8Z3_9LAMI